MHVLLIPVPRDRLLPGLAEGLGDIAVANLTITPERRELVDFSDPFMRGVDELIVSGPGAEPLSAFEDLVARHQISWSRAQSRSLEGSPTTPSPD